MVFTCLTQKTKPHTGCATSQTGEGMREEKKEGGEDRHTNIIACGKEYMLSFLFSNNLVH